jgi:hypothetical protein
MLVSKVGGGTGRGALESMAAANGRILRMTADGDSGDRKVFVILDEIDEIDAIERDLGLRADG